MTIYVLPKTKLWGNRDEGYIIVLACVCGSAVEYPGHPDDRRAVVCGNCGAEWTVKQ